MSNPVSLFEQLNKIKPKVTESEKPKLELVEEFKPNIPQNTTQALTFIYSKARLLDNSFQ